MGSEVHSEAPAATPASELDSYRAFPPGLGTVLIPEEKGRAVVRAGIAMYAACRPGPRVGQALAFAGARWLGAVPGARTEWAPPMPADAWQRLTERWRATVGPFDCWIVHLRQSERDGFTLLLGGAGRPVAFVKLRPVAAVRTASKSLDAGPRFRSPPVSFFVPRTLDAGHVEGWCYTLQEALQPSLHKPVPTSVAREIAEEISETIVPPTSRHGIPAHWTPMHGDLAPWNVRRLADGRNVVLDWEDAAWGPPHADRVHYLAAAAAVARSERIGWKPAEAEARRHWLDVVANREPDTMDRDSAMRARLIGLLEVP